MTETTPRTTSNGFEISNSREVMDFDELRGVLKEYELDGESPRQRIDALKQQSVEKIALFISDVNRRIQGSEETLVHDATMKIGEKPTINPGDRYDLFVDIMKKVKGSSSNVSAERVGDVLALTTVLLHPFKDGNGRTARMLGFIYRDDFDAPDASDTFSALAESRDSTRSRGGDIVLGYIPYMHEGADQSNPQDVSQYIDKLLHEDGRLYTGTYGQAPLERVP